VHAGGDGGAGDGGAGDGGVGDGGAGDGGAGDGGAGDGGVGEGVGDGGVGDGGVGDGGVGDGGVGDGGVVGGVNPRCDTTSCCALTTMAPSRDPVLSFGATLNEMLASPFPDAGDNAEIQLTAVEASHAHSGLAVRLKLPRPPPASIVGGEPNEISHGTAVGFDTLEEDSHPPMATAATINSAAIIERRQRQWRKSILHLTVCPQRSHNGASAIPERVLISALNRQSAGSKLPHTRIRARVAKASHYFALRTA
jgi:hypothetical protein